MPVKAVPRGGKFRVVEAATGRIATTPNRVARDGGGHETKEQAEAQARAINRNVKSA